MGKAESAKNPADANEADHDADICGAVKYLSRQKSLHGSKISCGEKYALIPLSVCFGVSVGPVNTGTADTGLLMHRTISPDFTVKRVMEDAAKVRR